MESSTDMKDWEMGAVLVLMDLGDKVCLLASI